MSNFQEIPNENEKKWENHLPEPFIDPIEEKRRLKELRRVSNKLHEKQRKNSSFATSHIMLQNISEIVQKPAMWVSAACTVPGLSFAGYKVLMGEAYTVGIFSTLLVTAVAIFVTLIYWNLVERFRLFATQQASNNYYETGFSTENDETGKTVYHGIGWYIIMIVMFGISAAGSCFSVWNIALTTGYDPKSIVDGRQSSLNDYDSKIRVQDSLQNAFVAKKQKDIDEINNGGKYKWEGKITPAGHQLIKQYNAQIAKETDSRSEAKKTLESQKMTVYRDAGTTYQANMNDMLDAAKGNGVFAVIFILITEFGIFFSVWAEGYYDWGCVEEMRKRREFANALIPQNKTTPPPAAPVILPTPTPMPDSENILTPQHAIKALHNRMANASAQNNHAEVDVCIGQLQAYGKLGYNMDTGEFVGIPQAFAQPKQDEVKVNTLVAPSPIETKTRVDAETLDDEDLLFHIKTAKHELKLSKMGLADMEKKAAAPNATTNTKRMPEYQKGIIANNQEYVNYLLLAAMERGLSV